MKIIKIIKIIKTIKGIKMDKKISNIKKKKRIGILLGLCLVLIPSLFIHAKDLKIVYNFQNGNLSTENSVGGKYFEVRRGANIIFKIININRFAYKVIINGEAVTSRDNIAAPPQPNKWISSRENDPNAGKETETGTSAADGSVTSPIEQMKVEISQLKRIKELQQTLIEIQNRESTFLEFDTKRTDLCLKFMNSEPSKKEIVPNRIIEKCANIIDKARLKLNNIKTNYIDNGVNQTGGEFVEIYSQLRNLLDECDRDQCVTTIQNILSNVRPENFTVTLTLPSVEAEMIEFTVKIEPIDPQNMASINQIKGAIVVKVKGGWVIDYSTGVFVNVNTNDLEYWFDEGVLNKSKFILRSKKKTTTNPVVGQLMHVYPQSSAGIKWCVISLGLGTGDASKLNYYLGTGLILGAKSRFIISAGVTAQKMDKLLPKFSRFVTEGTEIDRPNSDVPITQSVFKLGYFLSLTYNILGGNK